MHKIVADIRDKLNNSDLRLTPQREAVLRILLENREGHVSADQVYAAAKELSPDIGLATVYRTLDLFEKMGIVYRLECGDGLSRYEFNPGSRVHYHHHLICMGCGKVIEVNEDLLGEVERIIEHKVDFKIVDHCLRIFGYCPECYEKQGF